MSGDRQPRPGDRVRVQARATEGLLESFDEETGSGLVIEDDGMHRSFRVPFCSVEVLEPADDPSKDPRGTLRREEHDEVFAIYQRVAARPGDGPVVWLCTDCSAYQQVGQRFTHDFVAEFPIIGAVPGTAAAEQPQSLQPGPRPAPKPGRCRASEGATGVACSLPRHHPVTDDHEGTHEPNESIDYPLFVRWPWQQYDRDYADVALPEWEQELIREDYEKRQQPEVVDASTLFPPPVGTAPRVFTSDGPEPPEDVMVVVAVDHGDYPHPYFVRFEDGWSCSPTPVAGGSRLNPVPWRNTQHYGLGSSFREVIS